MGKPRRGRGSRLPKRSGWQAKARQMDPKYFDEDLFAKQRNKIPLMGNDDDDDGTDEEMETPVLDIPEEDTSGSEEEEEEEEEYEEEKPTGLAAKMAKQITLLRRKQAAMAGDEDEEEEGETREKRAWGKSKKAYYSAENVDFELQSSDDQAFAEEEVEALRLQRLYAASMRPEDYGLEEEESLEQLVKRRADGGQKIMKAKDSEPAKQVKEAAGSEMAVERIVKDISLLSREEQMEYVMSDAPELPGLLNDLKVCADELENRVIPLEEKVRSGVLRATEDGLIYLEMKHLVLMSYCQLILVYLGLKAEGKSVRGHPVIPRLMERRSLVLKMQSLDKKVDDRVGKVLQPTELSNGFEGVKDKDSSKGRPNTGLLESEVDTDTQGAGDVERPPTKAPPSMKEDMSSGDRSAGQEARRSSARSAIVEVPAADSEGRPEEPRKFISAQSMEMMRERERLEALAKQEEDLFARAPLSKAESRKLKDGKKSWSDLVPIMDDLADDVTDLTEMDDGKGRKRRSLSQAIAEACHPSKKGRATSGDADLPVRDDIGDRRNKYEIQKSSRKRERVDRQESVEEREGKDAGEDEFYQQAKQLQASKKAAKAAKYSWKPTMTPAEEHFEGRRKISSQMEKNRGLTRYRKKLTKNPRKKYKLKHEKAVIRRKGQVREVKLALKPYGGEATGIRTDISRSVRLQY